MQLLKFADFHVQHNQAIAYFVFPSVKELSLWDEKEREEEKERKEEKDKRGKKDVNKVVLCECDVSVVSFLRILFSDVHNEMYMLMII